MKKTLLFTVVGAIAVGGITLAALNDWGGDSPLENQEGENVNLSVPLDQQVSNEESAVINNLSYDIAYHINEQLYRTKITDNGFSQPVSVASESDLELIEMEKHFTTSLVPKDVFEALPISSNMIFYSGLQSNLDPNLWIYTERKDEGTEFNVRTFNVSTKETKVLFGQDNSPNKEYGFKPFAISNDNSVLYLEAFVFDSYLNNEEVWALNLNTLKVEELNVHSFYTNTPAMSPDGKYFIYPAASQPNDVHVTPNQLYLYDIEKKEETRIVSDDKAFVGMKGWVKAK